MSHDPSKKVYAASEINLLLGEKEKSFIDFSSEAQRALNKENEAQTPKALLAQAREIRTSLDDISSHVPGGLTSKIKIKYRERGRYGELAPDMTPDALRFFSYRYSALRKKIKETSKALKKAEKADKPNSLFKQYPIALPFSLGAISASSAIVVIDNIANGSAIVSLTSGVTMLVFAGYYFKENILSLFKKTKKEITPRKEEEQSPDTPETGSCKKQSPTNYNF